VSWEMTMRFVNGCVSFLSAVTFLTVLPATAQSNHGNYIFLLASGFLCDSGDSGGCQAVVRSGNGDSYEMSGAGVLNAQRKSAMATGTFAHKSSNGDLLETGVWITNELVGFDSYGIAPDALMQKGSAFGTTRGPKGLRMPSGSMPTGGLALFRIQLFPMSGGSTTAVLQANCALGNVPRERSVEGIRLKLERNDTEYSEELGGRVMFLSIQQEVIRNQK
jgi:hypothetical protein